MFACCRRLADGAYTKRPFVRCVQATRATLVGLLRKAAALRDLPPCEKTNRRGRRRQYGKDRISLARRAAHPRGWQTVTPPQILEAYADRTAIEQVFHHVKEIWGRGQQHIRNVGTNIAVWHPNQWMHTLTNHIMREFSRIAAQFQLPDQFRTLLQRLLRIAS